MKELTLRRRLVVSAASLLVVVLALYTAIFKPFASKGTPFTAEFTQAGQGLGTTSPVKIRGMEVGKVNRIELLPNGRARLTLRINDGVRLPDTTVASLEPASVFGPKFVNLLPGEHETTGPYLPGGSEITNTSDPRDLNDLLADANAALAALDPSDIAIVVDALAQGLGGQGENLRETIESLEVIVQVAHDNRKNARTFLKDLGRLASIRGAGEDVASIVADTNAVIDTAAKGDGRLRRFALNVAELSATTGRGLHNYGGDLREGFHSGERAVGVIYAQLGLIGPGLRTGNNLLPVYRKLSWPATGTDGRRMLAVKILLPSDPCQILLGVCPQGGSKKTKKGGE
ncbi:MCE family protein [Actinocorallia sp. B10E7]|uniref:MlaD family protein n=1 Tax=Actinocorallia sp. B10E7 TaxID=3153558 RepID=UPI00325CB602